MQRPKIKGVEVGELLDLRAADGGTGLLSGYASKFWVVDSYGEAVAPGAFQTSIKERGPDGADRILLRYEHAVTVGKATRLAEDNDGLIVEAKISDDGRDGTALRRQLADEIPYGLSIGFYRKSTRPATAEDPLVWDYAPAWIKQMVTADGDPGIVTVHTDMKLVEFSAVSFPAVDNALVEGYRAEALSTLLTDLKAGRLSDGERTVLQELAEAWLADVTKGKGETPEPEREPQTAVRNHRAEADFLFARLRALGVDLDGAHAA